MLNLQNKRRLFLVNSILKKWMNMKKGALFFHVKETTTIPFEQREEHKWKKEKNEEGDRKEFR